MDIEFYVKIFLTSWFIIDCVEHFIRFYKHRIDEDAIKGTFDFVLVFMLIIWIIGG